jgi:hypothetical protein
LICSFHLELLQSKGDTRKNAKEKYEKWKEKHEKKKKIKETNKIWV